MRVLACMCVCVQEMTHICTHCCFRGFLMDDIVDSTGLACMCGAMGHGMVESGCAGFQMALACGAAARAASMLASGHRARRTAWASRSGHGMGACMSAHGDLVCEQVSASKRQEVSGVFMCVCVCVCAVLCVLCLLHVCFDHN